jgi:hypothetical protein
VSVELGHAIVGFVEAHAGHERDFHRWYDRDHLYSVGRSAPGTLSTRLWLAPSDLRAMREPSEAQNPISGRLERGTHLSTIWVEAGRLQEQQEWIDRELERQRAAGRMFAHRDHLYTHRYELLGSALRDADAPPVALALDRPHAGLVATWLERPPGVSLEGLATRLADDWLPALMESSPLSLALILALLPKPAGWPADLPEPPGLGERLLVLQFLDQHPREAWHEHFARSAAALGDRARLLLSAPFEPSIPGGDEPR